MLATSPLAAMRSAPTMTASASPRAINDGPAPSTTMWWSIPICTSSNAVSREPCSSGRVSSAVTDVKCPRSCNARTMPRAVPHSTQASPPVLQCVCTRNDMPQSSSRRAAPRSASAWLVRTSSSHSSAASATTASTPSSRRPTTRRTAHDRFTAVGRAAAMRSASARTKSSPSPSRSARCAARATANPPATPIAGAPRTARRRMASIIVSTSRTSSHSISWGSRVWSIRTAWSPRHSMVRITGS